VDCGQADPWPALSLGERSRSWQKLSPPRRTHSLLFLYPWFREPSPPFFFRNGTRDIPAAPPLSSPPKEIRAGQKTPPRIARAGNAVPSLPSGPPRQKRRPDGTGSFFFPFFFSRTGPTRQAVLPFFIPSVERRPAHGRPVTPASAALQLSFQAQIIPSGPRAEVIKVRRRSTSAFSFPFFTLLSGRRLSVSKRHLSSPSFEQNKPAESPLPSPESRLPFSESEE